MANETMPVPWLTHDPDVYRVVVDVPAAADDGVAVLEVFYDGESNRIEVTAKRRMDA